MCSECVCVYNCNSVVVVVVCSDCVCIQLQFSSDCCSVCVHVMVLGCVSIMMCVVSSRHKASCKDWQRLCDAEEAKTL